ncbi:MAG: endonuclease III [Campylobacterales bacterium]|nr:endonuclease III [Campylobacterales bacterium]
MKTEVFLNVMGVLKEEYPKWEAPVVTLIAELTNDPYKVLFSTILSLRTKDEVTEVASKRLFGLAPNIDELVKLDIETLEKTIYPVGFYKNKAKQIVEIAKTIQTKYNKKIPDTIDELLKFKGVGRKTANLVVSLGHNKEAMCVDIHVHRITNRMDFLRTKTPDDTEFAIRKKVKPTYWRDINDVLVGFGQTICRPVSPYCSKCPVEESCPKKGVGKRR